jgi:NAD(P)H-hydrate epimerase
MKIVTAAQMQGLDRWAITQARIPGLTLMEHAGAAVVAAMQEMFGPLAGKPVAVVCGKGHNGGDGLVVARLLRRHRARVQILLLHRTTDLAGDARTMFRRLAKTVPAGAVHVCPSSHEVEQVLTSSALIVDALLGTGLSAPVQGPYLETIETINLVSYPSRPVVAVDLPSGIHADTGAVLGAAVRATLTVTFALPKLGLYVGPGIDHAGTVRVAEIGMPHGYESRVESRISLLDRSAVIDHIPPRIPSAHKGVYGHAGIIAGSVGKTGAAALAAKAALRVGAGLVTVATPASVNDTLEAKLLEAMTIPMPETKARTLARSGLDRLLAFIRDRTAVAIGPGLTTHPDTVELVHALVAQMNSPSVLDADALNALAGRQALLASCKVTPILTPHPGEMARLEEEATPQSVNADRIGTASRFAQGRGVVVVLKGARTVVSHPDGRVAICPTGNPGMATAGTGDVLTGILVGLLAQRLNAWDAACAGTYLHGRAGDLAAARLGPAGMVAGDVIEHIPHALQ